MKKIKLGIATRLTFSFGIILTVFILLFHVFTTQITKFAGTVEKFYDHPFTVSNTVRNIETDIIKIHRAMKDLALSNKNDIKDLIIVVDELETGIILEFNIVYDRYLGQQSDIDAVYNTFLAWREIREEVITLTLNGDSKSAADITRGKGARHVNMLEKQVNSLVIFANKKAEEFHADTIESKSAMINMLILFFSIAGLFSVVIIYFTIRSIFNPLRQIVKWIRNIAAGKLKSDIELNRDDEIGALADSCRIMQNNLTQKSEAAKLISDGIFSSRAEVMSEEDEVAVSINRIADNFSSITEENRLQNWQMTGLNMINEVMQGEQDLLTFSSNVISGLCSFLEFQIGAFYIADNRHSVLRLTGSYAFNLRDNKNDIIPYGDGLTGQVAEEKSVILVTDVPDDFFRIYAGTGDCRPSNIIAVPILHEGELMAVIELGSVRDIGSSELNFLKAISNSIGIGINSVQSRDKTDYLLRETQQQAAELTRQQEILRVTNDVLEEKTDILQKQKESLDKKNTELDRVMSEIADKAENLKQSNSYKSEFMANMSHELRTPLNSIIILSKLLSRNEEQNLSRKQTEFADIIHSSGYDLLHLIDEILDLSKIEAGQMEILREKSSIDMILNNMKMGFQQLAAEKKLEFKIQKETGCPESLFTDTGRVEQILKNLLSNAFKFTNEGSVFLSAAVHDSCTMVFSVKDTGIGIPEEKRDIIFEAFKQADGTTNRLYGGTGLGLSISLELARILGGELKMKSKSGQGATFSLYLPLPGTEDYKIAAEPELMGEVLSKEKKDESEVIREDKPVLEGKKILLVDDDLRNVYAITSVLEEKGAEIITAMNGKDAMKIIDTNQDVDLVLMDIMMPVMNGYETISCIRETARFSKLPIIALTAKAMKGDKEKCIEAGACDYLAKPVEVDQLLNLISRWLNG